MSKIIEMPDELYEELREVAAADRTTPLGWIAARLRRLRSSRRVNAAATGQTLAERLVGRVGVIRSGGQERLAERAGEAFADILEEKRRAGRL